jgi:hypothetical protein
VFGTKALPFTILLLAVLAASGSCSPGLSGEEKMGLELEWIFNTSDQFDEVRFGAGHQGAFTVYDIDADGRNEILFGTRRGDSKRIWCLEQGEPGPKLEWIYPEMTRDGLPGDPTTKPSLIDVDGDGVYEICFAGRGGRLHVLRPDGTVLWTWDNPYEGEAMHGAPQAWDVDGDGYVEFFLNDNPGYVHRVNHFGDLVWTSHQSGAGNQGHPTICDVDRDGRYEVIYTSQDHNLYCLSADTGQRKWVFDSGQNMKQKNDIVMDLNDDGEYEIIIWGDRGAIHIVSCFGEEISRWEAPREWTSIRSTQALGDVDEDGSMDLAVMTASGVFVIDLGGTMPTTKWGANFTRLSEEGLLPEGAISDHFSTYQLIADIDGDGEQEILWLAPFPIVTDGATGAIEGYYVNDHIARSRRQENGAWWGDVDGDGISEWICELNGNSHPETLVYCLTMGGSFPADAWWPEYYHCALPGAEQRASEWLKLKAPYSNAHFFPVVEGSMVLLMLILLSAFPALAPAHGAPIKPDAIRWS